ncbi:hypothetical protein BJY01DRAFT_124232 [Aspergillus pseudoustus]|uniref:Uncharacterized protein n=1 Tax=Aspergillus pseudoustus TaxID=1810923 RepID=A0ABR4IPB6_9EURO
MISLKNCLAILAVMPIGIAARDCTTTENTTTEPLTVSTPEDLAVFDGCTTIAGDMIIDYSFAGSFILNGVTNFNGSITMNEIMWARELIAIEMLDLLEMENLHLPQAWGLKSLNLTKLQHVNDLSFIQGATDAMFDLGGLTGAERIEIAGTWTNISLPSLETISSLTIATDPSWNIPSERAEPLEIHLPSLREAGWTSIRGHVSRLETPKLEKVGIPNAPEPNGMEVLANYTDLSGVYLVSLEELWGALLLDGYISGVNLNGMYATNATTTIRAASPMSLYSGLQDAGVLDLSGEFEALYFEDLFTATSLSITSDSIIECTTSLVDVYNELNYPREASFCSNGATSNQSNDDDDDDNSSTWPTVPSYEDYFGARDDDNTSKNHGVPTAVIVLLPVFAAVACFTAACCCVGKRGFAKRERQGQRQVADSPGGDGDVEAPIQRAQPAVVRDRYGHGYGLNEFSNDLPPAYSVDTPTQERNRYF